jgi:hypothetical protein
LRADRRYKASLAANHGSLSQNTGRRKFLLACGNGRDGSSTLRLALFEAAHHCVASEKLVASGEMSRLIQD